MFRKASHLIACVGLLVLLGGAAHAQNRVIAGIAATQTTPYGRENYTLSITVINGQTRSLMSYQNLNTGSGFICTAVQILSLRPGYGVFCGNVYFQGKSCRFRLEVWQGADSSSHRFTFSVVTSTGQRVLSRSGYFDSGSGVVIDPLLVPVS
jgi:hypothetical protein